MDNIVDNLLSVDQLVEGRCYWFYILDRPNGPRKAFCGQFARLNGEPVAIYPGGSGLQPLRSKLDGSWEFLGAMPSSDRGSQLNLASMYFHSGDVDRARSIWEAAMVTLTPEERSSRREARIKLGLPVEETFEDWLFNRGPGRHDRRAKRPSEKVSKGLWDKLRNIPCFLKVRRGDYNGT